MSTTAPAAGTRMDSGEDIGAIATIRLGMKYSPLSIRVPAVRSVVVVLIRGPLLRRWRRRPRRR